MARTVKEQLGVDLEDKPEPEVIEVDKPEADDRPDWLLEKFKTPEEQARAYAEAEKRIGQEAESRKQLETQLTELTAAVAEMKIQPQQQTAQQAGVSQSQLQEAYENDPIGTMAWLAQQYSEQGVAALRSELQASSKPQQEVQNQILAHTVDQQLSAKFDDWGQYKNKVAAAIQTDDTLLSETALQSPEKTAHVLENVYKMIKADEIMAQVEAGTFTTESVVRMKQQAQTLGGAAGRPAAVDENEAKIQRLISAAKTSSYSSLRGNA